MFTEALCNDCLAPLPYEFDICPGGCAERVVVALNIEPLAAARRRDSYLPRERKPVYKHGRPDLFDWQLSRKGNWYARWEGVFAVAKPAPNPAWALFIDDSKVAGWCKAADFAAAKSAAEFAARHYKRN